MHRVIKNWDVTHTLAAFFVDTLQNQHLATPWNYNNRNVLLCRFCNTLFCTWETFADFKHDALTLLFSFVVVAVTFRVSRQVITKDSLYHWAALAPPRNFWDFQFSPLSVSDKTRWKNVVIARQETHCTALVLRVLSVLTIVFFVEPVSLSSSLKVP